MDMVVNILWMVALWVMISRTFRAIKIIQYQKMIQEKQEAAKNQSLQEAQKIKEEVPIEMVEDLVCGKSIEKNQAYQLSKEGHTHYFCSWDCRDKFIEEQLKQPE